MHKHTGHSTEHILWYRRPASRWEEALPLGNGRIGAMVFGGMSKERIALNEDTLWSGFPSDQNKRGASSYFAQAQHLMLEGKYKQAQTIIEQHMQGGDTQFYMPLGDLLLYFDGIVQPLHYHRSLDLHDALHTTTFDNKGVSHKREAFVSAPDQALYLRLSVDVPGTLNFSCCLKSQLRHTSEATQAGLSLQGICPSKIADDCKSRSRPVCYAKRDDRKGMRFCIICDVQTDGAVEAAKNGKLIVRGASEAVLRLCTRTSFNGFDRHPYTDGRDEQALCKADLRTASQNFDTAFNLHRKDHQALYDRCSLQLSDASSLLATDERLTHCAEGMPDDGLFALLFHYGRYLLIACSREGTQPATLQGIWNPHLLAPWRCNYTLNINTEMNYWPAEICNLTECHEPLLTMTQELLKTGIVTAKTVYGARGAVVHHNSDLWRLSNPVSGGVENSAVWAFWPMGLGWLCLHLVEHYEYTDDEAFIRSHVLPVLRQTARFYLDVMTDTKDGYLSFLPATSPENRFRYQDETVAVAKSAQMSTSIIRFVLTQYLRFLRQMEVSEPMADEAVRVLKKLPDYTIGAHGELLEWNAPYEEAEPYHRHVSHLLDLFPGEMISPEKSPSIAKACANTLRRRGDAGTGWSMAWKTCLWARLQNGDKALSLLLAQLKPAREDCGGTYPNLLDSHPPFQIDGNFGACAGIARMLLDSQDNNIHILPALPSHWSGEVHGLCAKGGIHADICFENGSLTAATVFIPQDAAAPSILCQGRPADSRVMVRHIPV